MELKETIKELPYLKIFLTVLHAATIHDWVSNIENDEKTVTVKRTGNYELLSGLDRYPEAEDRFFLKMWKFIA